MGLVTLVTASCGVTNTQRGVRGEPAPKEEKLDKRTRLKAREVEQRLLQAHRYWKGTPYRWGGDDRSGIDCSAFTLVVMKDVFNISLPRTTREQLRVGRKIRRGPFLPGDLLFFKTGKKTYHVGIVVNRNDFLHASTSKGVTIASYRTEYWRRRFIAARRVL